MKHLYYFGASWCAPCKTMLPLVEKLAKKYDIKFNYVDVEYYSDLAVQHNVVNVPTLVLKNNEYDEVARLSGVQSQSSIDRFLRN